MFVDTDYADEYVKSILKSWAKLKRNDCEHPLTDVQKCDNFSFSYEKLEHWPQTLSQINRDPTVLWCKTSGYYSASQLIKFYFNGAIVWW